MKAGKKYRMILCFVLSTILCALMVSVVFAKENDEMIKVAVMDYPNYLEMQDDGTVSGYAYEYLQEIAQYTGWKYEFVRMTFAEAMSSLEKGDIDILPGNQYTEQRAEKVNYSSRSMGEGGSVLCVKQQDMRYSYNDYRSYGGMKIAALAGSVRMEQAKKKLAKYGVKVNFIEYVSDEAAKEALERDDVDAVLMSSIRCESEYKILARLDTASLYFCINKSRPEIKSKLDEAMETIHLDNPYYEQELDEKYYGAIPIQLAFTKEEKEFIAQTEPITVALSDDFAPNEYYSKKDNCFHGIVPDIMELISQSSGLQFEYIAREDQASTLQKVDAGEIMMIASVADRPEIADSWNVILTDAYRNNSMSIVINNSDQAYQNLDSLVVLKEGYPYLEQAARDEGYSNFTYVDSFQKCMEMVHNKSAILTMIPSNSVNILVEEGAYDDMGVYLLPNSNVGFSVGVSKAANPLLVSILNKAIASITDEERNALLIENLNIVNDTMSLKRIIRSHRVAILVIVCLLAVVMMLAVFLLAERRKLVNQRLEAALKRADAASIAKTDFLSRMSHDIRTPMNAIIGLTHLAKEEENRDTISQYLDNIDISSKFLLGLINDILDMSKIESGALKLNPEPYAKKEFEQSINTVIKPLMDAKNITFVFEMTGTAECIMVDKLRFNQIFFNLLSNASKFTPAGGKVAFIIQALPKKEGMYGASYCVRDNGIGMSQEYLPHIFESFSQERTKANENEKGTGLGLPIVKSLVTAMNGTITVTSELGKGTEFRLELYTPLAENIEEHKEEATTHEILKGARILLVEDNEMNILVAKKILEKEKCETSVAKNGQQAVDMFIQSTESYYQAILMDVRMPIMNGLDATRIIRALDRPDAKKVPIIAMTADAFEEEQKKTIDAGMNYHLAKPIDPKQMYEILAQYIERTD